MTWPNSLIAEIASRRCIIFIGAGASAGCTNNAGARPPSWEAFLNEANARFIPLGDRPLIEGIIREKQYLDAAEIIFSEVNEPDAQAYFREVFFTPNYLPGRLQEIIKELDSKIVITTNYDVIYEKACEPKGIEQGYIVKEYYNEEILDEIRSPSRLIIKAHGCARSPRRIILTRSKYFEAKKKYQTFYNLLDSLFLINTVLFIGCGLSDPDIQLVLENSNISVPSTHPHYALVASGRHVAISSSIKKSYNIQLLEYDNLDGTHSNLIASLEDLLGQVQSYRSTIPF